MTDVDTKPSLSIEIAPTKKSVKDFITSINDKSNKENDSTLQNKSAHQLKLLAYKNCLKPPTKDLIKLSPKTILNTNSPITPNEIPIIFTPHHLTKLPPRPIPSEPKLLPPTPAVQKKVTQVYGTKNKMQQKLKNNENENKEIGIWVRCQ
jgi:hypothetical protein